MDLPTVYRFPGDEETYMIGSEVGSRLDLFKGALYKKFPKLWRRVVTKEEKKILAELGVSNRVLANWELMCIRASDGEAILKGEGLKFKGPGGFKPRHGSFSPTRKQPFHVYFKPTLNPTKALRGGESEVHLTPLMNTNVSVKRKKDMQRRAQLRKLISPTRYSRFISFNIDSFIGELYRNLSPKRIFKCSILTSTASCSLL